MKVYSIGREAGCDIVIHDNTDVISRRHAVLNVMPSGKMTITDMSHNGTYVNGIRISPNVAVPVTRKDNVSLAHVAKLDWNQVPKPVTPLRIAFIALAVLVICVGGWLTYSAISGGNDGKGSQQTTTSDSIATKKSAEDSLKVKKEKTEDAAKNKTNRKTVKKKSEGNKVDKPNKEERDKKTAEQKKEEQKKEDEKTSRMNR